MSEQAIDWDVLNQVKETMKDKFPTMVQYFIEDAEMYINSIKEGLSENDASKVVSPAHTIKSSARQMGAIQLSKYAESMESISRNIVDGNGGNISDLKELCSKLESEFKEAEAELKKISAT